MLVNVEADSMKLEGVLDEHTSLTDLQAAFAKVKRTAPGQAVTLDLSKVSRANSSGILTFLKFLKSVGEPFKYTNAPVWLVNQFNMISGYFEGGSYVESFQAPFYAPDSQSSKNFTLRIGQDVPLLTDYSNQTFPNRKDGNDEFEMDFEPKQYFLFITQNYENFKNLNLK